MKLSHYVDGAKPGDYSIKTVNKSAAYRAKEITKASIKRIETFAKESAVRIGIPENEIHVSIEAGIRRLISEGTSQFMHLRKITNDTELLEKEMKKTADFVADVLKNGLGKNVFGKSRSINSMNVK